MCNVNFELSGNLKHRKTWAHHFAFEVQTRRDDMFIYRQLVLPFIFIYYFDLQIERGDTLNGNITFLFCL